MWKIDLIMKGLNLDSTGWVKEIEACLENTKDLFFKIYIDIDNQSLGLMPVNKAASNLFEKDQEGLIKKLISWLTVNTFK